MKTSNRLRNREHIYRILYTCTDHTGVINRSQGEMAELLEISYQQLSKIYSEFVDMGMMKKDKYKFTVLYHPDQIPWGSKYDQLRATYIKQNGAINGTKSGNLT